MKELLLFFFKIDFIFNASPTRIKIYCSPSPDKMITIKQKSKIKSLFGNCEYVLNIIIAIIKTIDISITKFITKDILDLKDL